MRILGGVGDSVDERVGEIVRDSVSDGVGQSTGAYVGEGAGAKRGCENERKKMTPGGASLGGAFPPVRIARPTSHDLFGDAPPEPYEMVSGVLEPATISAIS